MTLGLRLQSSWQPKVSYCDITKTYFHGVVSKDVEKMRFSRTSLRYIN